MRKKGIAELIAAMMPSATQTSRLRRMVMPLANTIIQRMIDASPTRNKMMESGGSSRIAISLKKNVQPQKPPRMNSKIHSTGVMRRLLVFNIQTSPPAPL